MKIRERERENKTDICEINKIKGVNCEYLLKSC